jgi:uncharacterized protein (UPF0254 family)
MIRIATAECFTHGEIGRELHALAQDYEGNFGCKYIENPERYGDFDYNELSVTCSLFIPTIKAVKKILNVSNPPQPNTLIKGIKVYDEKGDREVSKIMAKAVMKMSDCDMAIGTTAGVGHGAVTIITKNYEITAITDVYADLNELNSKDLYKRSQSGIRKTLEIILLFLNDDFDKIKSMKNVEIVEK